MVGLRGEAIPAIRPINSSSLSWTEGPAKGSKLTADKVLVDGGFEKEREEEEEVGLTLEDRLPLDGNCVADGNLVSSLPLPQEAKGSKESDREGGICCCCVDGWVLGCVFGGQLLWLSSEMLNSSKFSSSEAMAVLGVEKNSSRVIAGLVVALAGSCGDPFLLFILVKGLKVSCCPVALS